jgi:hypothetical protein
MRYLFEGMTWDAGAFSSEKGKCRLGTKENKIANQEDGVHASATKKMETYCY